MRNMSIPFESSDDAVFKYEVGDCNDDAMCGFLNAIVEYGSANAIKMANNAFSQCTSCTLVK